MLRIILTIVTLPLVLASQQEPAKPAANEAKSRKLLGGFRVAGVNFARGTIAVDWTTRTMRLAGKDGNQELVEYQLPEQLGTGDDLAQWPVLQPTRKVPAWWMKEPNHGMALYVNGICHFRGKWWVSVKAYYDTAPPPTLRLYAEDGEVLTVRLGRQAYSGFVKRGPGQDPYLGCGGYESGQGWTTGPTLATLDGRVLIGQQWTPDWNGREKRPPNYSCAKDQDSWVALKPRMIDGKLEGRWACDRVYGGGLVLPEGVTYWCFLGTGVIDYNIQHTTPSDTFAITNKTYEYRYDKSNFRFLSYTETKLGKIGGQDLDPKGRIWLCESNAWRNDSPYVVDPVLRVFE
jgi:hypothetical protein